MPHECEWCGCLAHAKRSGAASCGMRLPASDITLDERTRVSGLSGEAAILEPRKRPAAGWVQPPGAIDSGGAKALEHAEHDGADKGDCQIRGNDAQPADQRTHEGHREISLVHVTARSNTESSKAFQAEKVSPAALFLTVETLEPPPTWLKSRENNALKSP